MNSNEGFLRVSEAPFLKYLLSFVFGIFLQMVFGGGYYLSLPFIVVSAISFIYYYKAVLPRTKFVRRNFFGYAIFSLFIALGIIDATYVNQRYNTYLPINRGYAIALITDDVVKKERSIECKTRIIEFENSANTTDETYINSILYIEPDSSSVSLSKGDVIIFEQRLQPIKFSKNPESFNYALKLNRDGYIYSQYVTANNWKKIDYIEPSGVINKAENVKKILIKRVDIIPLSDNSKSLIKAMLLGESSAVEDNTRASFSASGLSHILAVSGLHVGIIVFIIYLFLFPFNYTKISCVRPLITILILWAYIFVIGFPPSGVRAAIMASFVLMGEVFNRKGTTINSLFVAALFMLIYNPNYIYDVGFQLSFTAVFSIFYLYPIIFEILPHSNRVSSYISSICSVTIAAQVGTLPLTIYYFHQLPLLGVFTNFIIIPLLPYIIILSIFAIALPLSWVCISADYALKFVNYISDFVSSLPYSSLSLYIDSYDIILCFVVIYMGCWALRSKRSEILISLLIIILLFVCFRIYANLSKENYKGIIYDDNRITAINFIDKDYNYILTIDTCGVEKKIDKIANNFWIKEALPDAKYINDNISDKGLYITLPYIGYKGEKYLILNSDYFESKHIDSGKRLFINKAIVCAGFKGSIADLNNIFVFEKVIIASNINHFKRQSIIKECNALNIPFYDIKEKGAYIIFE